MFSNANYNDRGLLARLKTGEVSSENASSWFRQRTFTTDRLVKFLSVKTMEGSNDYPCNTVRGTREGEPCSFPFFYPDCKLMHKTSLCKLDPGLTGQEYAGCYKDEDTPSSKPWCYTRTYHNRSHFTGDWGYCSQHCIRNPVRSVSRKTFSFEEIFFKIIQL